MNLPSMTHVCMDRRINWKSSIVGIFQSSLVLLICATTTGNHSLGELNTFMFPTTHNENSVTSDTNLQRLDVALSLTQNEDGAILHVTITNQMKEPIRIDRELAFGFSLNINLPFWESRTVWPAETREIPDKEWDVEKWRERTIKLQPGESYSHQLDLYNGYRHFVERWHADPVGERILQFSTDDVEITAVYVSIQFTEHFISQVQYFTRLPQSELRRIPQFEGVFELDIASGETRIWNAGQEEWICLEAEGEEIEP
jgi:hypothetical protein